MQGGRYVHSDRHFRSNGQTPRPEVGKWGISKPSRSVSTVRRIRMLFMVDMSLGRARWTLSFDRLATIAGASLVATVSRAMIAWQLRGIALKEVCVESVFPPRGLSPSSFRHSLEVFVYAQNRATPQ